MRVFQTKNNAYYLKIDADSIAFSFCYFMVSGILLIFFFLFLSNPNFPDTFSMDFAHGLCFGLIVPVT